MQPDKAHVDGSQKDQKRGPDARPGAKRHGARQGERAAVQQADTDERRSPCALGKRTQQRTRKSGRGLSLGQARQQSPGATSGNGLHASGQQVQATEEKTKAREGKCRLLHAVQSRVARSAPYRLSVTSTSEPQREAISAKRSTR